MKLEEGNSEGTPLREVGKGGGGGESGGEGGKEEVKGRMWKRKRMW